MWPGRRACARPGRRIGPARFRSGTAPRRRAQARAGEALRWSSIMGLPTRVSETHYSFLATRLEHTRLSGTAPWKKRGNFVEFAFRLAASKIARSRSSGTRCRRCTTSAFLPFAWTPRASNSGGGPRFCPCGRRRFCCCVIWLSTRSGWSAKRSCGRPFGSTVTSVTDCCAVTSGSCARCSGTMPRPRASSRPQAGEAIGSSPRSLLPSRVPSVQAALLPWNRPPAS